MKMYKLNEEDGSYDELECDLDQRKALSEIGYVQNIPDDVVQVEKSDEKPLTAKQKIAAEKEQLRRDALTQEERDAEDELNK